jgi:hypothetical protein
MSDELTSVQRLRHGLDLFLSKDVKAGTDSCAEDVVAEFPLAPESTPAVIEGRAAFYEYLVATPRRSMSTRSRPRRSARPATPTWSSWSGASQERSWRPAIPTTCATRPP